MIRQITEIHCDNCDRKLVVGEQLWDVSLERALLLPIPSKQFARAAEEKGWEGSDSAAPLCPACLRWFDREQQRWERKRYVTGIPRKPLPEGRVLVHNQVIPQPRLGVNGFRAWTQTLDRTLEVCGCDWAGVDLRGLVHYRVRQSGHGAGHYESRAMSRPRNRRDPVLRRIENEIISGLEVVLSRKEVLARLRAVRSLVRQQIPRQQIH